MKITKTMNNKALSYLKKASGRANTRPSLAYANKEVVEEKAFTVMTDGYSAFYLQGEWDLPMFKDREDKTLEYPSLQRVTPPKGDIEVKLPTLQELKEYIDKTPKVDGMIFLQLDCSNNDTVWLEARKLKTVFEVLGTKTLKATTLGTYKPVRFEVEGEDSFAILCPIRRYD